MVDGAYLLWRNDMNARLAPWDRMFLDAMTEAERRQLVHFQTFCKAIRRHGTGHRVQGLEGFVLASRTKLASLRAYWETRGFTVLGLSGLGDQDGSYLPALFHDASPVPVPGEKIHVRDGRVELLFPPGASYGTWGLIIQDFDSLPLSEHYRTTDLGPSGLHGWFDEQLPLGPRLTASMLRPFVSSQVTSIDAGGMTLGSLRGGLKTKEVREFLDIMKATAPPAIRKTPPPPRLRKGKWIPVQPDGLEFHFRVGPFPGSDRLDAFVEGSIEDVAAHLRHPRGVREWGFHSTFGRERSDRRTELKQFFQNYFTTNVTLPEPLDKILDIDQPTDRLERAIDERVWRHILMLRERVVLHDPDDLTMVSLIPWLTEKMDAFMLEPLQQDTARARWIELQMPKIKQAIHRTAFSLARDAGAGSLEPDHLGAAARSLMDNFGYFMDNDDAKSLRLDAPKRHANMRHQVVQDFLIENPGSTKDDIWYGVEDSAEFKDAVDLQGYLNWAEGNHHLIRDGKKRYTWLGKVL